MPPAVGEMMSPPRLGGKRMRSYTEQARCHAGTDARCLALFLSIPAGGWDRRLHVRKSEAALIRMTGFGFLAKAHIDLRLTLDCEVCRADATLLIAAKGAHNNSQRSSRRHLPARPARVK